MSYPDHALLLACLLNFSHPVSLERRHPYCSHDVPGKTSWSCISLAITPRWWNWTQQWGDRLIASCLWKECQQLPKFYLFIELLRKKMCSFFKVIDFPFPSQAYKVLVCIFHLFSFPKLTRGIDFLGKEKANILNELTEYVFLWKDPSFPEFILFKNNPTYLLFFLKYDPFLPQFSLTIHTQFLLRVR